MEHSVSYTAGYFVGLGAALIVVLIAVWIFRRRNGACKREYDERQKLAQGKAYKWGYYTLLAYMIGVGLFDLGTGIVWADRYMEIILGVFISITVYAAVCIHNDAYVAIRERPAKYAGIFFLLGAFNILPAVINAASGLPFIENGVLTSRLANPIAGVILVVLGIVLTVKYGWRGERE